MVLWLCVVVSSVVAGQIWIVDGCQHLRKSGVGEAILAPAAPKHKTQNTGSAPECQNT
jgi:hypothetical protein